MSTVAYDVTPVPVDRATDPALEVAKEILRSELALEGLLLRAERLHRAHIEHEPLGCLVCFSQR